MATADINYLIIYLKQWDDFLVSFISFHLDVNVHRLLLKSNLRILLILCENAKDDVSWSLIPIISTVNQLLFLALQASCISTLLNIRSLMTPLILTSLFPPTNKCLPSLHPLILRNSSNSKTLREQQLQPFEPSWKIGAPGWW